MDFTGTAAIVTGGAGGLGEAVVRALHAAGGAVVIADLADGPAADLADELGDRVRYVRTDVLDDDDVTAAITAASELATFRYAVIAHGGFGVAQRVVGKDNRPAEMAGFEKTISLYLNGTYNVLRLTAAAIAATDTDSRDERGAVVATASIAGYEGQVGQSAYAAAKAGVIGLTLAAARDLAPVAVRVNTIAPGTMLTPRMASVGEEMLAGFAANVPFPRRLGQPSEFADLALHLLSNTYLNGEVVRLDGAQRFQPR
ncbi:SDR family oxidoreductase [uncultured Williamsia sp.]|uniref:SDR family oxidoreductase n=1 Tax=uncultured Williamsia sp. TaxID=259311 RepID=UPI002606CB5B|nr:SDR family oxidoreductase [uncultured Williamsia sp.]